MPLMLTVPSQLMVKPVSGVAPASHCSWPVGGVRMQPGRARDVSHLERGIEVGRLDSAGTYRVRSYRSALREENVSMLGSW